LDYNHRALPRGTFTCSFCGFAYSRIGPDTHLDDQYRIGTIIDRGNIWKEKLLELWFDPEVTIRCMAATLHSSWDHLRRKGTELGLPFPPPGVRVRRRTKSPLQLNAPPDPTPYRELWLAAIQQYSEYGMNYLREQVPSIHYWLCRYDREWLQQHTPHKKRKKTRLAVDWQQRDNELAAQIETTYEQLMSRQNPPFRVTTTAILTTLRRLGYYKRNHYRLPQTCAALARTAESIEAFVIRRVWHVARQLHAEGLVPRRRVLVERTGVYQNHDDNPQIQTAVDAAMNWLQGG
jgi:hypothetical protein